MVIMHKLMKFLKIFLNKTVLLVLAVAVVLILFFYWGWFEKQYYKAVGMYYVYKGDKAYAHSDLQKAIDYYNSGLKLYPEHYGAWYNLGNIYVVYEDFYSASNAYKNAISYNPKFTLAKMNLGIISAEKLGDFDEAIRQYNSIIGTDKKLLFIPFIFNNKKSEKYNRGLAYYNMGVAYKEKSLYNNGNREHSSEYITKSITAYKNAVKILKDDYDSRFNLALSYHLTGDYKNAGLSYCKAIELQPMDYEAHYNLAVLLKHLKMYREAYDELEKASMLVSDGKVGTSANRYVFDVLNDVSRTLVAKNQYDYLTEKVDDVSANSLTYVHGKIVASEALDKAILENLRTCDTKDFFEKY